MKQLIQAAQTGDNAALEALWAQTQAFAFTVLRRYVPTVCVDSDDLQQCAWLGFFAAVHKYEEQYNFLTCMEFCIRMECRKALRIHTSKREPLTVSYDVPAHDEEHAMVELFEDESLPDSDAPLIGADLVRDVRAAVAELPERERKLIELRWLGADPLTLDQVSELMGISRQRVSMLEQRAFERLRADPVLQTYAPRRSASISQGSGLMRFLTTGTSSTERQAISRIRRKDAYTSLLESLAASGHLA